MNADELAAQIMTALAADGLIHPFNHPRTLNIIARELRDHLPITPGDVTRLMGAPSHIGPLFMDWELDGAHASHSKRDGVVILYGSEPRRPTTAAELREYLKWNGVPPLDERGE